MTAIANLQMIYPFLILVLNYERVGRFLWNKSWFGEPPVIAVCHVLPCFAMFCHVLPKDVDLQVRLHTRDDVSLLQGLRKWHAWSSVELKVRPTGKRWRSTPKSWMVETCWNHTPTMIRIQSRYQTRIHTKPGSTTVHCTEIIQTEGLWTLGRVKSPVDSCKRM